MTHTAGPTGPGSVGCPCQPARQEPRQGLHYAVRAVEHEEYGPARREGAAKALSGRSSGGLQGYVEAAGEHGQEGAFVLRRLAVDPAGRGPVGERFPGEVGGVQVAHLEQTFAQGVPTATLVVRQVVWNPKDKVGAGSH